MEDRRLKVYGQANRKGISESSVNLMLTTLSFFVYSESKINYRPFVSHLIWRQNLKNWGKNKLQIKPKQCHLLAKRALVFLRCTWNILLIIFKRLNGKKFGKNQNSYRGKLDCDQRGVNLNGKTLKNNDIFIIFVRTDISESNLVL